MSISNFKYNDSNEEAHFETSQGEYSLITEFNEDDRTMKLRLNCSNSEYFFESVVNLEVLSNYLISKFRNNINKYRKLVQSWVSSGEFTLEEEVSEAKLTFRIRLDENEYELEVFSLNKKRLMSQSESIKNSLEDISNRIDQNENEIKIMASSIEEEFQILGSKLNERFDNLDEKLDELTEQLNDFKDSKSKYDKDVKAREDEWNVELNVKAIEKITSLIKEEMGSLIENMSLELYRQNEKVTEIKEEVNKSISNLNNVIRIYNFKNSYK